MSINVQQDAAMHSSFYL